MRFSHWLPKLDSRKKRCTDHSRRLRIECLEMRTLLSIAPGVTDTMLDPSAETSGIDAPSVLPVTVTVSDYLLAPDPQRPGETALFIYGTDGDDVIRVWDIEGNIGFEVYSPSTDHPGDWPPPDVVYAQPSARGKIYVYCNAGNDNFSANVNQDMDIDGGNGDDFLVGGYGCDRIFGGEGNDSIYTGKGDQGFGGSGDDSFSVMLLSPSLSPSSFDGGPGTDSIGFSFDSAIYLGGGHGNAAAPSWVYVGGARQDLVSIEKRYLSGSWQGASLCLYDSPAAETVWITPGEVHLQGADYEYIARYFTQVEVYATPGGGDEVHFSDLGEDDQFYSSWQGAVLTVAPPDLDQIHIPEIWTGFKHFAAWNFSKVFAEADPSFQHTMRMYAPATDDLTFEASPGDATLADGNFSINAKGFYNVQCYGSGTGTARLHASPEVDDFIASPVGAVMKGPGYDNSAWNFRYANGLGTRGQDYAWLYGGSGTDNQFTNIYFHLMVKETIEIPDIDPIIEPIYPPRGPIYLPPSDITIIDFENCTLSGINVNGREYSNSARCFRHVSVFGNDESFDQAILGAAPGENLLEAMSNRVRLSTDSVDQVIELIGFEKVEAHDTGGTNRVKKQEPLDYELVLEGDWIEI